jgi:hypothetical protein
MTKRAVTAESLNRPDPVPTEAPKPVVLRWEWRTFAPRLSLPREWADAPSPDGVTPSCETYFVSLRSMHDVKLRFDCRRMRAAEVSRPLASGRAPEGSRTAVAVSRSSRGKEMP